MVYVDASLVENERAFPSAARRDPVARRRVAELFDAIDYGSQLGVEEALVRALDVLLGTRHASNAAPALSKVRERIDAECCAPLGLQELSALAGLSATGLLRAFERAYGLTPHRYQHSRRIAKAKMMIVGGAPLADVAVACGYSDQSHLNRWFLRIQGITAGRLRRAILS
jgi:AraC-like DNA-binding protein